jgi:hypothetical protein
MKCSIRRLSVGDLALSRRSLRPMHDLMAEPGPGSFVQGFSR